MLYLQNDNYRKKQHMKPINQCFFEEAHNWRRFGAKC